MCALLYRGVPTYRRGATIVQQMSQSEPVNPYRVLYEKSVYLRVRSSSLLRNARDLCLKSQRLREGEAVQTMINPHRRKQRAHLYLSLPVSLAIDDSYTPEK